MQTTELPHLLRSESLSVILIPGRASADHRPRFGRGRGYRSAKYTAWVDTVATYARASHVPLREGYLEIVILVSTQYAKQTDVDNLTKGVLDGLEGIAYENDRRVIAVHVYKAYVAQREAVIVLIYPANDPAPALHTLRKCVYKYSISRITQEISK